MAERNAPPHRPRPRTHFPGSLSRPSLDPLVTYFDAPLTSIIRAGQARGAVEREVVAMDVPPRKNVRPAGECAHRGPARPRAHRRPGAGRPRPGLHRVSAGPGIQDRTTVRVSIHSATGHRARAAAGDRWLRTSMAAYFVGGDEHDLM